MFSSVSSSYFILLLRFLLQSIEYFLNDFSFCALGLGEERSVTITKWCRTGRGPCLQVQAEDFKRERGEKVGCSGAWTVLWTVPRIVIRGKNRENKGNKKKKNGNYRWKLRGTNNKLKILCLINQRMKQHNLMTYL